MQPSVSSLEEEDGYQLISDVTWLHPEPNDIGSNPLKVFKHVLGNKGKDSTRKRKTGVIQSEQYECLLKCNFQILKKLLSRIAKINLPEYSQQPCMLYIAPNQACNCSIMETISGEIVHPLVDTFSCEITRQ